MYKISKMEGVSHSLMSRLINTEGGDVRGTF